MIGYVKDIIEGRGRYAMHYGAEGSIIVVETETGRPLPAEGQLLVLERPDGWSINVQPVDVRQLSPTAIGFFAAGLKRANLPLHTIVRHFAEVVERETQRIHLVQTA